MRVFGQTPRDTGQPGAGAQPGATELQLGELTGLEITASPTPAGTTPLVPNGNEPTARPTTPSPLAAALPDLAPILRRLSKLERQRNVMLAVLVPAVAVACFALWRSWANETPSVTTSKVIEAERIVLLDAAGQRGPSVAIDDGGTGGFAFYDAGGAKLATLKDSAEGVASLLTLIGPAGKAGVSLIAGKDYTGVDLSDSEGKSRGIISVWKNRAQFTLYDPDQRGSSASLAVGKDGPELTLYGPGVWGVDKAAATATLDVSKHNPGLWLSRPNCGKAWLHTDRDGSGLALDDDARLTMVHLDANRMSSGLTVRGAGQAMLSAEIVEGKKDGRLYPSISITDANGRTVFEKP
jgi:hypothetical protein